jgi:hypothetical protein
VIFIVSGLYEFSFILPELFFGEIPAKTGRATLKVRVHVPAAASRETRDFELHRQ